MGYDMFTAQAADEDERTAVAAALAHANSLTPPHRVQAGPEHDAAKTAWDAAWKAYDQANKSYFRLNVWGMSYCRDAMAALGMLTFEHAPGWPAPGEFGLDEWPDDPADEDDADKRAALEAALTEPQRQLLAASRAVIAYEPQPVRGIPAMKLGSNDGWLVTPAQIEAALARWDAAPDGRRQMVTKELAWWPEWIAYLRHAKDRGGFHVH